ncbi:uncharacterized protein LOC134534131 [Bacillus rossius redtenbacheri]|uniref:uncharacterized protein LOC134534131 n=1 Tax=Bacillus rossius redtenbacheri TaxID=93214 RepID=UPI002FDDC5EA
MTRVSTPLLLVLAALCAAASSLPSSIRRHDDVVTTREIVYAMSQMAEKVLSQNKEISEPQDLEGKWEMRISGFSGVIRSGGNHDKEEDKGEDKEEDKGEDKVENEEFNEPESLELQAPEERYARSGSSSYRFHGRGAPWLIARDTCAREGAHLAVPNSPQEARLLAAMYSRHGKSGTSYDNQIWVGVSDLEEEGSFVTVLGEELGATGYSSWYKNQPDDWRETSSAGEDCVTLRTADALLNDLHCSARMPYVCEMDHEVSSPGSQEQYSPTLLSLRPFLRL